MSARAQDQHGLAQRVGASETAALARAISVVENGDAEPLLAAVYEQCGRRIAAAPRIGITGSPGAGKSTLVAALIARMRARAPAMDARIGVVAVDPTSPFSHGAILGDRVRLPRELATDPAIYFRSLATRGALGGLALAAMDVVDLVAAWGASRILIETVGVGQSEIDIASAADTVILILQPQSGDEVQSLKAGVLEIADIVVVGKADLPGAAEMAEQVRAVLQLSRHQPPVVLASALAPLRGGDGDGLAALESALALRDAWLDGDEDGVTRRAARRREQLAARIVRTAMLLLAAPLDQPAMLAQRDELANAVFDGRLTPRAAARALVSSLDARG